MKRAAAALVIAMIATPAAAADRCLTKTEARALWPRSHLYWSNYGAQRCWSNRRGKRWLPSITRAPVEAAAARRRVVLITPPPAPLPFIVPPAEIATAPVPPRLTLFDGDRWQWIAEARAALHDDGEQPPPPPRPVYSTFFLGAEPDTWPPLEQPDSARPWLAFLFGLVMAEAVAIVALMRWKYTRI